MDAHASERRLIVLQSVLRSLPIMQDRILVLGLTLRGVVSVSGLITNDDDAWWRVVSSFMRALAHCVPMAETLYGRDSTVGSSFATR